MFWNEEETFEAIASFEEVAKDLRSCFEEQKPTEVLVAEHGRLVDRWRHVCELIPKEVRESSSIDRHLSFMRMYLRRSEPEKCDGDAKDLATGDIYLLRRDFSRWLEDQAEVDAELREKTSDLLKRHEYDSAVRKAFVILKTRLVEKYQVDAHLDGVKLINEIYGEKSSLSCLPASARKGYRDLLAGLFGLFRNSIAHQDRVPNRVEVQAVFSMVNYVLLELESARVS